MKAPSIAQQTMSGEHCPLLGGTLPAYETFVAQWQAMATSPNHPQLAPFIQEGLSWATSYHKRMRANKAYLFAMCRSSITLQCSEANFTLSNLKVVDPSIRFSWVQTHWSAESSLAKAHILAKAGFRIHSSMPILII